MDRKRCRIGAAEMECQQEIISCWLSTVETIDDFPSPSITFVPTRIPPLCFSPFNPFGTEIGGTICSIK